MSPHSNPSRRLATDCAERSISGSRRRKWTQQRRSSRVWQTSRRLSRITARRSCNVGDGKVHRKRAGVPTGPRAWPPVRRPLRGDYGRGKADDSGAPARRPCPRGRSVVQWCRKSVRCGSPIAAARSDAGTGDPICTDDPLLAFRSAVYSASYAARTSESLQVAERSRERHAPKSPPKHSFDGRYCFS
jgi:hypothetical protein